MLSSSIGFETFTMKIKFNQKDKTIEIQDSVRNFHFSIKLLLILNLVNPLLNLVDIPTKGFGFIQVIWVLIGVISIVLFFYLFFKKSTLSKIPLEMIQGLKEKTSFGKKRFYIFLKNGKSRDLMDLKTQAEFEELKKVFVENGIPH